MCIAILNKKGLIADNHLRNSWANNYHGAGFAYSQGDRFYVYKNDTNVSRFIKAYKKHRNQNPDAIFLLHFRISTHGNIDKTNLHPFVINDSVALIHNGMIDLDGHSRMDERSDTRFLCEEILSHLPDGWHLSKGIQTMLEQLGGWSKFVMLGLDNQFSIVNEKDGHWCDLGENWYSNTSYKHYSDYVNYGGKMVKRGTTGSNSTRTSHSWSSSTDMGGYVLNTFELDKVNDAAVAVGLMPADKGLYSVWGSHEEKSKLEKVMNNYHKYSNAEGSDLIKINTWYSLPNSDFNGSVAKVVMSNQPYTILRLNYRGASAVTDYFAYYVIKGDPVDVHLTAELVRTMADTSGKHSSFQNRIEAFLKEPIASTVIEHLDKCCDTPSGNTFECEWCGLESDVEGSINTYGYTVCKNCSFATDEIEDYKNYNA